MPAIETTPPSTRVLLALGLLSACALGLQVGLTRLFSAVLPYHFSFLAISLAMLGTGAGALLLSLRPEAFVRPPRALLATWSGATAAALIAVPLVLVRLDFDVDTVTAGFVANLAAACLVAAVPSFTVGVAVAVAIVRYAPWIGRVYAFDLGGAGLGSLLVVPALWLLDAPTLLVALGGIAAISTWLFADAAGGRRRALGLLAIAAAAIGLARATPLLWLPPHYRLPPNAVQRAERWTPLARVLGYELVGNTDFASLFYDRVYAPVPIARDGVPPSRTLLRTGPQSIGYELAPPGRVLVIGGGGGRDIWTALGAGRDAVDVVELNEGIRRVVDEDLGRFSGGPYSRPGVHTTIGDGRSTLAGSDARYAHIHIGFTDTLSANAAQGFALTENNLYTMEAFAEYLSRLAPGGVLNVSRQLKLVGDEALRASVLALAALGRAGAAEPARHLVVVLGEDVLGEKYGTLLARLVPWTDAEVERIRALAHERGQGLAFPPEPVAGDEWRALAASQDLGRFCREYPLDVCPPTDDRPFFFHMRRRTAGGAAGYLYASDPASVLLATLGILTALVVVAIGLPLAVARQVRMPDTGTILYFAALGLGFLLVESVLVQRFVLVLGFPTYALSVVLAALLVFTGVGAQIAGRAREPRRAQRRALLAAVALIAGSAVILQPLLRTLIPLPFVARLAVCVVLLAPFGLLLGMAMPLGLRRLQAREPAAVPFAWAVNGVTSVLATVLAVATALEFGFAVTSLLAAACYAVALAVAWRAEWAAGA